MTTKLPKREMNKGFATYTIGGLLTVLWVTASLPILANELHIGRLGKFSDSNFVAYNSIVMNGTQFRTYFLSLLFSIALAKLGHLLTNRGDNRMRSAEENK